MGSLSVEMVVAGEDPSLLADLGHLRLALLTDIF